ncbi:MAG: glycosyltransferase family 4 protein [Candidatus Omnitrophota bacterium]|nr:MAG: glycosyltransferase family 4 protein [Candidatus Omnitrophota bacterium]
MIRILYVIENIFFGGGERAFSQIINGLDKKKYQIYVACLPGGVFEEEIKGSAKILPFDLRNRFNLVNIYRLAKIMKEHHIQLVHSQAGRGGFFVRVAARKAGIAGVVSTVAMPVEGFDVGLLRRGIYIGLDRFSEKFVDKFIVVSEALRRTLNQKHKISPEKIVKIHNGVELNEYKPDLNLAPAFRKELDIDNNAILIGTIGRLTWQKGLPYFIQAAKKVLDTQSNVRFLVVGEGEKKKELEGLVKDLAIENRVIFTGFRKDVKSALGALDVFVLPSIREGQPLILLEAMAMGKPIVATDIEGVNEILEDGKTGALIPSANSSALAEAIVGMLQESKKTEEMGKLARSTVMDKFNIQDKVKEHQRLYEAIIA